MIILLESSQAAPAVTRALCGLGLWTHAVGDPPMALEVEAHSAAMDVARVRGLPGVRDVLATRSSHPRVDAQAGVALSLRGVPLGGGGPVLIAGPCAVESEAQVQAAAAMVAAAGGALLRGGAYKPRTSPYSFQGHGRVALGWLAAAARAHGLGVVTEVMAESEVPVVAEVADLVQLGARSMQNYPLLRAVGQAGRPVLLKRGPAARIEEWLLAGEHLLVAGAPAVVFCERGVVSFDPCTRNLLDLGAVAVLKHHLGQPVIVDPSHALGRRDLVAPLCRAALAAGADGVLVEAHPDPADAKSDGPQALPAEQLLELGRSLGLAPARDQEKCA